MSRLKWSIGFNGDPVVFEFVVVVVVEYTVEGGRGGRVTGAR